MPAVPRRHVVDINKYVGARIRDQRARLGLTQQKMADLIGVTAQQAHKYEKGVNRVAAGRLYDIATALGVDVTYFFEGIQSTPASGSRLRPTQRMMLELAKNFVGIRHRDQQEAICAMARALAKDEL